MCSCQRTSRHVLPQPDTPASARAAASVQVCVRSAPAHAGRAHFRDNHSGMIAHEFLRTGLALTLAVVATACAPGSETHAIVRDSAGVHLVANRGADSSWRNGPAWTATVDLTIGEDSLGDAYRFGRIGDLGVTSSGSIAVIDQLAGEVRIFGRDGKWVRTIGRRGEGPGELSRSANAVIPLAGDSLLVADAGTHRLTIFASDGIVGRTIDIPARPLAQSWALLPGGGLLYRGLSIAPGPDGHFAFWDALIALAADGTRSDTLFRFDYVPSDMGTPGHLRMQLIVNSPSWARLPDGRIAWTALDRDYVIITDPAGRLLTRVTSEAWITQPVTASDRAALVELLRTKLTAIGGDPSFADSPMVEAPPRFPAITAVKPGPDGTIWVQRMGPAATIDPMAVNAPDRADFFGGTTWDVLDRDGVRLGSIAMPPRFRIFRITSDAIYGAARDDDGVEHVVRLRLRRG